MQRPLTIARLVMIGRVVSSSHSPPFPGTGSSSPSRHSPNGASCGSLLCTAVCCGAHSEVVLGGRPSISQSISSVTFAVVPQFARAMNVAFSNLFRSALSCEASML